MRSLVKVYLGSQHLIAFPIETLDRLQTKKKQSACRPDAIRPQGQASQLGPGTGWLEVQAIMMVKS